jgi:hypothetical protein
MPNPSSIITVIRKLVSQEKKKFSASNNFLTLSGDSRGGTFFITGLRSLTVFFVCAVLFPLSDVAAVCGVRVVCEVRGVVEVLEIVAVVFFTVLLPEADERRFGGVLLVVINPPFH